MKNEKNRSYVSWGLTALAVVAASLAISFFFNRFSVIGNFFAMITKILMPIIYGFLMAFLLAPLYNRTFTGMSRKFQKGKMKAKTACGIARFLSTFLCIIVLLAVVVGLFAMLIPQLIESIKNMFTAIPEGMNSVSEFLRQILSKQPDLEGKVLETYNTIASTISKWAYGQVMPNVNSFLENLSHGVLKALNFLKDFLIGVIVMAYVLNIKGTLTAQCKKIIYSLMPVRRANDLIEESRYVKEVFSQFIVGKLIDSAIIGLLCFILMSILHLDYILLISVFVGVTNIIPFFGPFIGAIPSSFILLVVSPLQCLEFLIMIFALQQFDGNVLGPKILGQTTGLSSFWVLFSILFFGGLWGIVGMIIAVPTFAVIYRLVGRHVNSRLMKKHLSFHTEDYWDLKQIDEENGEYIRKEQEK